jgi:hypothetical protein
MQQIFVFTAGNPEARQHLAHSIQNPVDDGKVFDNFGEPHHEELRRIKVEWRGFYALGAVWGLRNVPTWEQMELDDFVLCVYDGIYRYVARLFSPSTTTQSAQKPSGAPTTKDEPEATCTS